MSSAVFGKFSYPVLPGIVTFDALSSVWKLDNMSGGDHFGEIKKEDGNLIFYPSEDPQIGYIQYDGKVVTIQGDSLPQRGQIIEVTEKKIAYRDWVIHPVRSPLEEAYQVYITSSSSQKTGTISYSLRENKENSVPALACRVLRRNETLERLNSLRAPEVIFDRNVETLSKGIAELNAATPENPVPITGKPLTGEVKDSLVSLVPNYPLYEKSKALDTIEIFTEEGKEEGVRRFCCEKPYEIPENVRSSIAVLFDEIPPNIEFPRKRLEKFRLQVEEDEVTFLPSELIFEECWKALSIYKKFVLELQGELDKLCESVGEGDSLYFYK